MSDKPFVINDRRKFTADGELRHDLPAEPAAETPASEAEVSSAPAAPASTAPSAGPRLVTAPVPEPVVAATETPEPEASELEAGEAASAEPTPDELPPLTDEQIAQVKRAYDATLERLDTALRAQNLGAEQPPPITFQSVIQSLFMQALMMLGGGAEPGQPVSVDPMGARQIIDMISAIIDKAQGNLSAGEVRFCENVLFELRMGFLDITQRLAQQAAARAAQSMPGAPGQGGPGGPSIVR